MTTERKKVYGKKMKVSTLITGDRITQRSIKQKYIEDKIATDYNMRTKETDHRE